MTGFETLFDKSLNTLSHAEIKDFSIHLKVRFGDEAANCADYFVHKHEEVGDFPRAQVWQAIASGIKANDAARGSETNRVNSLH